MYIDRTRRGVEEYPYEGVFTRAEMDESLPLDEREEIVRDVLVTKCDIQETSHSERQFVKSTFSVFFPLNGKVVVRNGDQFKGSIEGLDVNGRVVGVFPSTLGGCKCYIEDLDV